jgi:hypothetical protein
MSATTLEDVAQRAGLGALWLNRSGRAGPLSDPAPVVVASFDALIGALGETAPVEAAPLGILPGTRPALRRRIPLKPRLVMTT